MASFCNPIPLPNYPRGRFSIPDDITFGWVNNGERRDYRETADPSVLWHDGKWYLYASCGMAWQSSDFVSWEYCPMNLYDMGYAPTVMAHGGAFYLTASEAPLFRSDTPLGPWEEVGPLLTPGGEPLPNYLDPMCFSDEDGRVYMYWGLGSPGIYGIELSPDQLNQGITEPAIMFAYNPDHVWERYGEFNENPAVSYVEGPWLFKNGDDYYLTYAAPGTSLSTYAMGTYVSQSPLGPYTYQSRNPILRKTSGLVRGPGHGSIVRGPNETVWVFYTCTRCYNHIFERRIGFDAAGFDDDGNLFATATEVPQFAPGEHAHPEQGNDAGLLPVNLNKLASNSSSAPGRECSYAIDGSMRTWWQAANDDAEPWLSVDSRGLFRVSAVRLVWAEPNLNYRAGIIPGPYRYRVETKVDAGDAWDIAVDKSDNDVDMLIDYVTFVPRPAAFMRLVVVGWPDGLGVGVVDFTVFGKGECSD